MMEASELDSYHAAVQSNITFFSIKFRQRTVSHGQTKAVKFQNTTEVVERVGQLLEASIKRTNPPDEGYPKTRYTSASVPETPITQYLRDMMINLKFTQVHCIMMLAYLDTYFSINPSDKLHKKNVHRLVLVSLLLVNKYLEDIHVNNATFSFYSRITLAELNELEVRFLTNISCSLYLSPETYQAYHDALLNCDLSDAPDHEQNHSGSSSAVGSHAINHGPS